MKKQVRKVKIGLIFSLDYEIHGNGSGEFENWAYLPTSQMLDVLDTYGAKLTIMAEMGHYWAMKKYKDSFLHDISLFESQLKNAVQRGHDVQLHFHPQWIDATYEDGNWHLDFSRKTIERLCHNYDEAYFYLKKGKDDLEHLLRPVNPGYRCVCFRSGFLQMQPSRNIIKALTDAGFLSDSSVSKGMKADDSLRFLDYSDAFSRFRPWKTSSDEICRRDETGKLYEFPLLSYSTGFWDKIIKKIHKKTNGKNINDIISGFMAVYGKGMMPVSHSKSLSDKVKNKLAVTWYYADFCQRDHTDLAKYIKKVVSDCRKNNDYNYIPVVLLGHSKDFFFPNNLSLFLKSCKNIHEVEFITYAASVEKYITVNTDK
jgi:hypothetical protein